MVSVSTSSESDDSLDQIDITSRSIYVERGYPWEAWAQLRREAPVYWYDRPGARPHWAFTKYQHIQDVSRNPSVFSSATNLTVDGDPDSPQDADQDGGPPPAEFAITPGALELLINMDLPKHGKYRGLVNRNFTPRGLKLIEDRVDEIARESIDRAASHLVDTQIDDRIHLDFVVDIAAKLPMAAISELLGLPRDQWDALYDWTNQLIGAADPEYQQGRSQAETARAASMQIAQAIAMLAETKRHQPGDDLMTTLVQGEIDGRPLDLQEIVAYGFLLIIAGNETTRNATTGGLLALIEHPDQMQRLRDDPELLDSAVEEILRWTSPIIHMARVAREDVEIAGHQIRAGDAVAMWYPSANRDEEIFDDPMTFDIGRDPNDHLAFGGFGEHFCLGANLARLELQSVYRHLIRRMDDITLDGDVERLTSGFVGGIKHLPIRFKPA